MAVETIEPASGERKKELIFACEQFLKDREKLRITEYEMLNNHLVELLGGEYNPNHREMITPWLVDRELNKAIQFTEYIPRRIRELPQISLYIGPEWMAFPRDQQDLIRAYITNPFLIECFNPVVYLRPFRTRTFSRYLCLVGCEDSISGISSK